MQHCDNWEIEPRACATCTRIFTDPLGDTYSCTDYPYPEMVALRQRLIEALEGAAGCLDSVPYDQISLADLARLVAACIPPMAFRALDDGNDPGFLARIAFEEGYPIHR